VVAPAISGEGIAGEQVLQNLTDLLEAVGEGTVLADHFSPIFRPAFPSSAIVSERSSPSRVRFAAPNNGASLTARGRSEQHLLDKRERLMPNGLQGREPLFAAKMAPFFAATDTDYKSALNEFAQARRLPPRYVIVRERGPEHSKTFTVEARVGREWAGQAEGNTKKSATQKAARDVYERPQASPGG
jgi:hypothetical protein